MSNEKHDVKGTLSDCISIVYYHDTSPPRSGGWVFSYLVTGISAI
jgi:hypothetical protein